MLQAKNYGKAVMRQKNGYDKDNGRASMANHEVEEYPLIQIQDMLTEYW